MIRVTLINKQGTRFDKVFDNEFLANKFLNKVRYSKVLTLVSVTKEY